MNEEEQPPKYYQMIEAIHERVGKLETAVSLIPELRSMMTTISTAMQLMSHSSESVAETYVKFEERQERMEERHEALVGALTGRDQIPLKSHYWTLFAALLPTLVMAVGVVVGVLYVSKYDLKASLTNIEVNQHKTQDLLESTKDSVKKVEEQTVK